MRPFGDAWPRCWAQLRESRRSHDVVLGRIPSVPDLQAAWLLLSQCASPPCNYLLRMLPPTLTQDFAQDHDRAVRQCLSVLLSDTPTEPEGLSAQSVHLALRNGGLGLRSAARLAPAAYWASWADSLAMIRARHPSVAGRIVQELGSPAPAAPCLRELAEAAAQLCNEGFAECPTWEALAAGARPRQPVVPPAEAELEEGRDPSPYPGGGSRNVVGKLHRIRVRYHNGYRHGVRYQ